MGMSWSCSSASSVSLSNTTILFHEQSIRHHRLFTKRPVKPIKHLTINQPRTYQLVTTKLIFTVSVIIMLLTILFVWLFGLGTHRSLFENSITSTWILTTALYAFLFVGLYRGFKLKDNLGKVTRTFAYDKVPAPAEFLIELADDYFGTIIALILMSGTILVLLANILVALWTGILVFAAMLYWIYFRAIRFTFKWSKVCKGHIGKSLLYSFLFTLLYSIWFYGIIIGAHYVNSSH